LLVGSTHAAVMEVITLARRLNLDVKQVCQIIGSGIGGSDYFRLLSESVLDGNPSPGGLGQMCKDMSIVVNTGRDVKAPLYVATAAYYYFLGAQALKMENMEGADLIRVVDRISNPDTA
jgi:3-hydroxyisobutyrate dehydrogenase-like beta-hydroxyacid dehydrogenase